MNGGRASTNRSLERGQSYPLFYDTLFADLRTVLAKAATTARQARRGVWRSDPRAAAWWYEAKPISNRTA
jgi:hypothetical protein